MRRFAASRLKIRRAQLHLRDLQRRVERYFTTQPYKASRTRGTEPNEHIVHLHVRKPSAHLGVLTGEIVHHLRSALDYAIGELIEIGTGALPPEKMNFEFPIFDDLTRYKKARKSRIDGVPVAAGAVIDIVQPFQFERPHDRTLWLLHRLDIEDKHRAMNVVGGGMIDLGIAHTGPAGADAFSMPVAQHLGGGFPLEDGAELLRFFSVQDNPDVKLRIDQVYLGFTVPAELYRFEIIRTVTNCIHEVQVILDALEQAVNIPAGVDLLIDLHVANGSAK